MLKARDYKKDTITDMETGEVTPTGLPNSNVLYYDTAGRRMAVCTPVRYRAKSKILLRSQRELLWKMQMQEIRRNWAKQSYQMIDKMLDITQTVCILSA